MVRIVPAAVPADYYSGYLLTKESRLYLLPVPTDSRFPPISKASGPGRGHFPPAGYAIDPGDWIRRLPTASPGRSRHGPVRFAPKSCHQLLRHLHLRPFDLGLKRSEERSARYQKSARSCRAWATCGRRKGYPGFSPASPKAVPQTTPR